MLTLALILLYIDPSSDTNSGALTLWRASYTDNSTIFDNLYRDNDYIDTLASVSEQSKKFALPSCVKDSSDPRLALYSNQYQCSVLGM